MYCPECGAYVKDGGKYCPKCGKALQINKINTNNVNGQNSYKSSNNNNSKNNTKTRPTPKKKISTKRKCCYVAIAILVIYLIFAIPYVIKYNENREDIISFAEDVLNELDFDGDGYLTFDEAKEYANKTPEPLLQNYFEKADKNGNNLLKGGEFDTFIGEVNYYENPPVLQSDIESSNNSITSSSSDDSSVCQDYEEYDKVVGYDAEGHEIWVSYYYTSGNGNMEPGVYRYIGNEYTGYDIEYVSSD